MHTHMPWPLRHCPCRLPSEVWEQEGNDSQPAFSSSTSHVQPHMEQTRRLSSYFPAQEEGSKCLFLAKPKP